MTGGLLLGAVWLGAAALHLIYGVLFLITCVRAGRSWPSVLICATAICIWPLLLQRIMAESFQDD